LLLGGFLFDSWQLCGLSAMMSLYFRFLEGFSSRQGAKQEQEDYFAEKVFCAAEGCNKIVYTKYSKMTIFFLCEQCFKKLHESDEVIILKPVNKNSKFRSAPTHR